MDVSRAYLSRSTDQNRVHDMIGNLYTSGSMPQRIHVKPAVDLYKFSDMMTILLIYICNKRTRVHNTVNTVPKVQYSTPESISNNYTVLKT